MYVHGYFIVTVASENVTIKSCTDRKSVFFTIVVDENHFFYKKPYMLFLKMDIFGDSDIGDKVMFVSSTHFVSNIRHKGRCNPL